MMVELTDLDLWSRMRNSEDHFVERKTTSDKKGWVKTVVAFANSAPNEYPCVLYIGVKSNGEIEASNNDLDTLQRTFNDEMKRIYPPVSYLPKIIERSGKKVLAVIVYGSQLRPHFAGPSYVRKGSESVEACEGQFAELITRRTSKADKILSFKGKQVTVVNRQEQPGQAASESQWGEGTVVIDCNQFWLTLGKQDGSGTNSFPLSRVELNYDNEKNRLRLEINR